MTFHTTRTANEIYLWRGKELIYKRWLNPDGTKQASRIFNTQWPDVVLPSGVVKKTDSKSQGANLKNA